jgi:tetratricopeptide (TPR) repeat protein
MAHPSTPPPPDPAALLQQAARWLEQGRVETGEALLVDHLRQHPEHVEAHLLLARSRRSRQDIDGAARAVDAALRKQPGHAGARLLGIEIALLGGRPEDARERLDALATEQRGSADLAHDIAQLYMQLDLAAEAEPHFARALALQPGNTGYRYNHATALIALGRLDEAERALDAVIACEPQDHDAWYNRSTLRRQTRENNHVEAIERQLRQPGVPAAAAVAWGYALAKEREDLGDYAAAFDALKKAADTRRGLLAYRVEDDVDTMREIAAHFSAAFLDGKHDGCHDARPLFVVGLPRSGTTLVERILASHSRIGSRGESSDLALALTRQAGRCASRAELLQRSTELDFRALGQTYVAGIAGHAGERVVDKTPANFLYLGLVAKALPHARIVHVRRHPLDVCHAMYKTLFRMAYPFSYDLHDLARYWLAFNQLMAHWRAVLPAHQLLEVDYEQLVAYPETTARRLIEHAGLAWEPGCLDFHANPQPTLTASAAQVRQPIYHSSVGAWRRYETQLAPLVASLRDAGVHIDHGARA